MTEREKWESSLVLRLQTLLRALGFAVFCVSFIAVGIVAVFASALLVAYVGDRFGPGYGFATFFALLTAFIAIGYLCLVENP